MKPIQLQIVSGGKTTAEWDMDAALHLRLVAFAQENGNIPLMDMIERALRFAMEPDETQPCLTYPDENEIIKLAAETLEAMAAHSQ